MTKAEIEELRKIPEYIDPRNYEGMMEASISFLKGRIKSYEAAIEELQAQRDQMYSKRSLKRNEYTIEHLYKKINTINFIINIVGNRLIEDNIKK